MADTTERFFSFKHKKNVPYFLIDVVAQLHQLKFLDYGVHGTGKIDRSR